MRVSVQYGNVSHVRVERIEMEDGPWHKLYITDYSGDTCEICLFGRHNWPRTASGRLYDDIGWQGFGAVLRAHGTPDNPVHGVPFDDVADECDALPDITF